MDNKTKKLIFTIIIAVIATVAVIAVIVAITYRSDNSGQVQNTEESAKLPTPEELKSQLSDINTSFSALSAEMLEADGKTIKSQYTKQQQDTFKTILSMISKIGTYVEGSDDDLTLNEDEYSEFSKLIEDTRDLTMALDNDIHTNQAAFKMTFENLITLFDKLKTKMVSGDNETLIDEFKEYQSDFDEILKDTMALRQYVEEKNKNQTYYDGLTQKGELIAQKIKTLAKKANVSLE